jgi:hypothetical protein
MTHAAQTDFLSFWLANTKKGRLLFSLLRKKVSGQTAFFQLKRHLIFFGMTFLLWDTSMRAGQHKLGKPRSDKKSAQRILWDVEAG